MKIDPHKKYKEIYRVTDVFNVSFETDTSDDEAADQNLIEYINFLNANVDNDQEENGQT